jgi:HD-like signal output (HDOD) protein
MPRPIQEILKDIQSLEPLPAVGLKVLELSEQPDVGPSELTTLIETDAALTAKVLKLANSALYGCVRQIDSLHEAGARLGTRVLTNLVITGCAARHFRNYGSQNPHAVRRAWERSVANAISASLLSSISGAVEKHRAYTAGLLQDIGELVLERHFVRELAAIEAEQARGADLITAEKAVLGLSHADVGARLAARWNLPEVLVDTILCHHEPERARCDPLLASFVHLGSQVVQTCSALERPGSAAEEREYTLHDSAFLTSGFDAVALASVEERLVHELGRAQELLQLA